MMQYLARTGEDARLGVFKNSLWELENAYERLQFEKGFLPSDLTVVDANHRLVQEGYLREPPKNPWAGLPVPQASFVFVMAQNNSTGLIKAFLAGKIDNVSKYVDNDGNVVNFPGGWAVTIP